MRLDAERGTARETILAAGKAGITVLDTAHAYGADRGGMGHDERALAVLLRDPALPVRPRIVTKGGMDRPKGAWVPDGRAKRIAADCEASLVALSGLPIDLYLLHAPDPRTPWGTSVRALRRLVEQGMVKRVGVANVTRRQLDEAVELAPIAAVQVALSPFDDHALRGGVVARCAELGVTLIAHSPLGGPRRARTLARRPQLADVAARHHATAAEVALAWLLDLGPQVVAIPGAGKPQSARSAARAAALELDAGDRATLATAFGSVRRERARSAEETPAAGEVVLVMGIPGAGKSRLAADLVGRGYRRLNRDQRGGSLRALAAELDQQLASGISRVVLDNTYLSRAERNRVVETAERYSLPVRCVWIDAPLAQAQVNLVERLLERFGSLPTPEEIKAAARREPWLMLPTSQMRALRELEPPSVDEGFIAVERVPFARAQPRAGRPGVLIAASAMTSDGILQTLEDGHPAAPHLVFDWIGDADAIGDTDGGRLQSESARLAAVVSGPLDVAVCPHPGGPPACWCRPPLPGLPLAFARARGVDLTRSLLVGSSPAHRTLATILEARYFAVGSA
jgi:aryl-alcohol dehydrogenase-like predicted oxidoreductase/predicted kinase